MRPEIVWPDFLKKTREMTEASRPRPIAKERRAADMLVNYFEVVSRRNLYKPA